jgi:hypothetical protein
MLKACFASRSFGSVEAPARPALRPKYGRAQRRRKPIAQTMLTTGRPITIRVIVPQKPAWIVSWS